MTTRTGGAPRRKTSSADSRPAPPVPTPDAFRPGMEHAGFRLLSVTPLREKDETAWRFVHGRTGLQWLHFEADDPVSSCSIAVATPVSDNRGLPHVLEHLVFEGSKRHPGTDLMAEMQDRTVSTDLNGTTTPFFTFYQFSSAVESDMSALFGVWFDAILDPELSDEACLREAGRFRPADPEDPSGPLDYTGVVFNEMRACAPDPHLRTYMKAVRELLPDTSAGFLSGGIPAEVMKLTPDDVRAYHRRWYQPANMRICTRGQRIPFALLRDADARLAGVEPGEAAPRPVPQPRREGVREIELDWPVPQSKRPHPPVRRFVRLWLVPGPGSDEARTEAWNLFDSVLPFDRVLDVVDEDGDPNPCAPGTFRKVCREEGPDGVWGFFAKTDMDEDDFEEWFRSRFEEFLDNPETADGIRTAAGTAARRLVESVNAGSGTGETARKDGFEDILADWILGDDPFRSVQSSSRLGLLYKFRRDPEAVLDLVRDVLFLRPHRLDAVLRPVPDEGDPGEAAIRAVLRERRASLSDEECAALAERDAALAAEPPSGHADGLPETLLSDVPAGRFSFRTETDEDPISRTVFIKADENPRGEAWAIAFADLRDFPSERLLFLPHVLEAARRGAKGPGAEDGLSFQPCYYTNVLTGSRIHGISVSARLRFDGIDRTVGRFRDLFQLRDPLPFDRANRMVRKWAFRRKALDEWSQSHMANHVWATGATAEDSLSAACNDPDSLFHFVGFRTATVRPDADPEPGLACARLAGEFVREAALTADLLHNPARWTIATIGPRHVILPFRTKLLSVLRSAPSSEIGPAAEQKFAARAETEESREAETIDREGTSTIRISIPAPADSVPERRLLEIGAGLVDRDIAFRRIRREIGAYYVSFAWENNAFELDSDRNPDIAATLKSLESLERDVAAADWTPEDVRRAALRVARRYLTRPAPFHIAHRALFRHLSGATPERIKSELENLQTLEPGRIKRTLMRALRNGLRIAKIRVEAGEEAIEQANRLLPPGKRFVLSQGRGRD